MTITEFCKARRKTRLRARAAWAARLVLVKGWSQSDAARHQKLSRQAVHAAVRTVIAAHVLPPKQRSRPATLPEAPTDWQTVTVTVPAESAATIREVEQMWRDRVLSSG